MRKTIDLTPESRKTLPQLPGVYQYKDNQGTIIYIGKARNLAKRVQSYFAKNQGTKTMQMLSLAHSLSYIVTDSEFSALLLEAKLVRLHMPKYNIQLKDDKSPLYIVFTKEEFPRVLTLRQTQLQVIPHTHVYGPFVDGVTAKKVLKFLRRIFPYSQHKLGKRGCLYAQIGLCNPCPSEIVKLSGEARARQKKEYRANITALRTLLDGKSNRVVFALTRDMKQYAKTQEFERAQEAKERITKINYLALKQLSIDDFVTDPYLLSDIRDKERKELVNLIAPYVSTTARRIECFDIAHLAGSFPTASMVTFIDGEPEKRWYRHFRVSAQDQNNDTDSMSKVLTRRARHFSDWGRPDLIIVDGGKGQLAAALEIITDIPVIGLAKRFETIICATTDGYVEIRLPDGGAKNLVVRLRDEAHRFARTYHHALVKKNLLS